VAKERLVADNGPLFIGQTFIDVPATVIAQADRFGQVRVLSAFVSEGMSLRRHIETVIKPWLNANTRAFYGRRPILGAYPGLFMGFRIRLKRSH
jgi:hypothetical protein